MMQESAIRNPQSTMNFIRRVLNLPKNNPTTKLGRWQLHYDPQTVNSKIDQANEDHCGCCQQSQQTPQMKQMKDKQLIQQKQKWQEKKHQALMKKHSESENYYIPYVM